LRGTGPARDAALAELHDLLLRGAHHELARRGWPRAEAIDMAEQAADDALAAILRKLDDFRGESRFTTWAYKFVLLEAGVRARRRAWEGREVKLEDESWRRLADPAPTAERTVEESELLRAIAAAMESDLTARQREVLTALALDEVPIDVLAERLDSTRGALYKTLHDARRRLRTVLTERGYAL
jgi:RNA polymerase sigma-70 factor (ECF subfamily)